MLTPHDLAQIVRIVKASSDNLEAKINSNISLHEARITNKITKLLDSKIDTIAEQILEYTNALRDSHEASLKDHEVRIEKLEDHSFNLPK